MHTLLVYGSSFGALLCLINVYGANAKPQQGLPHEVTNITTAEPIYTAEPVIEPSLDNDTLIAPEPWSHPWLCEAAPPSIPTIHSLIYPSPDATPIEVTAQSQIVTSFQPEMTWCVGPAIALSPLSFAPFFNGTTSYTTVLDGTGRCETVYAPIETTVCATTLTGLASKVTITECEQEVTFSSECGFTLETPTPTITNDSVLITPAPTVKRMFTYWLAPWQSLTAGETPSDVDVKICTVLDNGDLECERYQEIWEVIVVTKTSTSLRTFDFTATVTGPGTVYVETLQAYITDTIETVGLSTVLLLETEVEIESTSSARRESTEVGTVTVTPTTTVFITQTVVRRPDNGTIEVTPEPTTTVRLTTVITRTNTTTVRRPRPRPSAEMPELAPEDF